MSEPRVAIERHEIVTGKIADGKIDRPFWAGDAFYHSDESYFELKIPLFDRSWFLSRNKGSDTYTIFKERLVDEDGQRFRQPIGKAVPVEPTKDYLRLMVPLWNPRFQPYVSLFPAR